MIVFDLVCDPAGHVFEAWFGSSDDYEDQRGRGLVCCPLCGSGGVDKAPMSPRLGLRGNRLPDRPPAATNGHEASAAKALLRKLAERQAKMLETSDYVGEAFADEARAIHLGESEARSIHGQTTIEQAHALSDEGIAVAPLPFPVRPPRLTN